MGKKKKVRTLDRDKPHSAVQGDSRADWFQNGRYFKHSGEEVSAKEAAKPVEGGGSFTNQVEMRVQEELARQNATKPLTLVDKNNLSTNASKDVAKEKAKNAPPPPPAKADEAPKEGADRAERRAMLQKLGTFQVRALVVKAKMTPAEGRGSKNANITMLLDNTE